jgi:hypothetical protein
MAERWKLTLRRGPKVTIERFDALDAALDAMERQLDGLDGAAVRGPARVFHREIAPEAQVATRAAIAGPQRMLARVHGGVDLRGDGSAEAWSGRVNKQVVERRDGESAVAALRRALGPA